MFRGIKKVSSKKIQIKSLAIKYFSYFLGDKKTTNKMNLKSQKNLM